MIVLHVSLDSSSESNQGDPDRKDTVDSLASPISLTPGKSWRVFLQKDFLPSLKILRKDWGNT
jgi:hypothetical protein